jgi:MFS transporter, FSR family, fosmidomycin resistance protein
MSQATETLGLKPASTNRIVGAVSAAHFVSHYYILLLAPLLPFVRADYGVSYTEIGFAFAAFNTVSAVLQTPAGFLVDRLGARILLVAALLIGAAAFAVAGLVNSFWMLVAMFALAGVGNAVYHPADYALLSHHVPAKQTGGAYSVHTFAGMLGSAVAPASLLMMQSLWGWRGAFVASGVLGVVVAAFILTVRENAVEPHPAAAARAGADNGNWRLLTSAPILLNLLFFMLLAMMSGAIYNYSVVALGVLYGTPVSTANIALTCFLLLSAGGVLIGGLVAGRTTRHGMVATLSLVAIALIAALIANVDLGTLLLIAAMTVTGFFFGLMMPSRDMIVREVTPPGSFGKVFGFVTTGFNIGGIVSPLIFGAVMDHGSPRLVFLLVVVFSLIAIVTVATRPRPTA